MDFSFKIFSRNSSAPEVVKTRFHEFFPRAKGAEWSRNKGRYEVIFTEDNSEKICLISAEGNLIDLKVNLSLTSIPEEIRVAAEKEGEIMNCISITDTEDISYELIVRDSSLVRYRVIFDKNGVALEKKKL